MSKRAVVVGATGLVGRAVVQQLLDDGDFDHVVTFARRKLPFKHERLEQQVIDFAELDKFSNYLRGAVVFCLLGTTIKTAGSQEAFRKVDYDYPLQLGKLAQAEGAAAYLIVTAVGANAKSRIFYSRVKGQLEEALRQLALPRLHLFRPSLLLGERAEFRLGEKVATVLAPIFSLILLGPLKKYKPIHASKIALSMVAKSKMREKGVFIYDSNEI